MIEFDVATKDWAQHGISGRGVLLDVNSYYTDNGGKLPYEVLKTSSLSVTQHQEVARAQGVTFRKGDILLLRVGFMKTYYEMTDAEKEALANRSETL